VRWLIGVAKRWLAGQLWNNGKKNSIVFQPQIGYDNVLPLPM